MRYWVCPKCECVNAQSNTKCDNCNLPTMAVLLLPNLMWVEFYNIEELDRWIATMRKMMGAKVFRKRD